MAEKLGLAATGNIEPSRVLVLSTSNPYQCSQAGANARPIGVSQVGSKYLPTPGAATLAAEAGDPVAYHDEGEIALVEYGGTVTIGAELEADAQGRAIVAATTTATVRNIIGIAHEAGAAGVRGKVKLRFYTKTNP
jgi:hypothetical protein